MNNEPFEPDEALQAQLAQNRVGKLTPMQRRSVWIASGGSLLGLGCTATLVLNVITAAMAGVKVGGVVAGLFLLFFLLTFGYLALTLWVNLRMFAPDALAKHPVKTARGKLKIRMAERERPEMPFSYIVGDYSFAPYVVPYGVPLQTGRDYVVYYAAHSRLFLNLEPADYADTH